jgi:hypothetical protein
MNNPIVTLTRADAPAGKKGGGSEVSWKLSSLLEWDYWMGTEVGQLGGYGFQGAIFGVDGSCKDDTMGSGCCKFQEEEADKCARVGREEEGTNSNRLEFGGIVLALQSAALSEDVLLLCDNTAVLCAVKSWYDKEERRR